MYGLFTTLDYRLVMLLGVVVAAVRICLLVIAFKLVWNWLAPELFPGLVGQGKIAGDISYKTALKVIAGLALLAFLYNPASVIGHGNKSRRAQNPAPVPAQENTVRPKGMVISTAKGKDTALISALRKQRPDITEAEIVVKSAGRNSAEEVLGALEWAEANGVKVIMIDGDSTRSADPGVAVKMKIMSKAGFYLKAL